MSRFSGNAYVPAVDSADNIEMRDVVGNKDDSHTSESIIGRLERLEEHVHTTSEVYPTLADGVVVSTDAAAWTLGALTEIVPASTITSPFDIHAIDVESISANGVYEIALYYGASDTYAGRIRIVQTAVQSATLNTDIQTVLIPANSRIRARAASAAGSQSVTISLRYHTY